MSENRYEILQELLPAYALGMTDADETHLVNTLLEEFPEVKAELLDYHNLAGAMLHSAAPMDPPEHLFVQLMQQTMPQPASFSLPDNVIQLKLRSLWMFIAVAAAAVLFLFAGNVITVLQVADLEQEQQDLLTELNHQEEAIAILTDNEARRFELAAASGLATPLNAFVLCNPTQTVGVLFAYSFPELPEGHVYQVWLTQGSERTSGGLFTVDEQGNATIIVTAPQRMGNYGYIGITTERYGGSDAPTNPSVARGALYNQDNNNGL